MKNNLARRLIKLPAQRLHLATVPVAPQRLEQEQPSHIVGQHPDAKNIALAANSLKRMCSKTVFLTS